MMGLLGNVAEVKRLRHRLMTTEFITVFSNLLDSHSDGIEVSFILGRISVGNTDPFLFRSRNSGELQCGWGVSTYRIRWTNRMEYRSAHSNGSASPDGCSYWTLESEHRTQYQLSELWTDLGIGSMLRNSRVSKLGCLGFSQFNKGNSTKARVTAETTHRCLLSCLSRFIHWNTVNWSRKSMASSCWRSWWFMRNQMRK